MEQSPLSIAAKNGKLKIVELLLNNGARLDPLWLKEGGEKPEVDRKVKSILTGLSRALREQNEQKKCGVYLGSNLPKESIHILSC